MGEGQKRASTGGLACRICGRRDLVEIGPDSASFPASLLQSGVSGEQRFLRCPSCHVGFRFPLPDAADLERQYQDLADDSYDYAGGEPWGWRVARKRLCARWHESENPLVLDVGCHRGRFLEGLPAAWVKCGIEPARSTYPALAARGIRVIADRLEEHNPEWSRRFDAVTMFDVIEHSPDPLAALSAAAGYVKPEGLLFVCTGDLSAWTWHLWGKAHWYLSTPQHLSVAGRSFFGRVSSRVDGRLLALYRGPHQVGSFGCRCSEAIQALYFACRLRGGVWRVPQLMIQSFWRSRALLHATQVPHLMHLRDHVLAVYQIEGTRGCRQDE